MADEVGSEDRDTWLYLIQIQYLDKQLERCQLKCDELEKQNKDLVSQYNALEKDNKDIIDFLKRSLVAKEKKGEKLAERLESQQQAAEQDWQALNLQHSQQILKLQEQINKLSSESKMQAAKFEEQQEQKEQLMQQLSDMESLEKQLASQQEKHEAAVLRLTREAEMERERIEKRQNAVHYYIKMKTSNIVQEERAQHSERLEKVQLLLSENMDLWDEKDAVRGRDAFLCYEVDDLKKNINSMTQESLTYKKEVEKLTKKCRQLEVKLKACGITERSMLAKEETLRQRLASGSKKCRQKTAEAGQLGAELQKERSRKKQLEGDIHEAVIILRHILEEAPESQGKIRRLQEILKSPIPQSTGFDLKDSTEKSSGEQKPQTSDPKPARAETVNAATDPLFLMARYRPGDLGLVPRPTWKHKPAIYRMRAPSTSTQLPLNRKLSQKRASFANPSDSVPHSDLSDLAPWQAQQ
ncbi:cilia- and flagella-associated protein 157-like [Micropterus salmoides]|uniref:cilia- and flagella-associated protein 157-like n=1 Tax=Micropterus salmoides TaxID=27706 RepID=UPI0018EDD726|nr:cilia- and flagella-associated protein 157-like [Micropterus salmoides]